MIKNVGGMKSFIAFYKSDVCDWTYVLLSPYESIMDRLENLIGNTIKIGILILVVGLLLSYPIFRKMFKPVDSALIRLKNWKLKIKTPCPRLNRNF